MVAEYRNLTGDLTLTTFVPEYLKSGNRKLIYQLFVKKKTLARSDVVSLTNMSFPTASKSIDYFIKRGIIKETDLMDGKVSRPGRKKHILVFNAESYAAISLNFQGDIVEIAIVDLAGDLLFFEERPFLDYKNEKELNKLGSRVNSLINKSKIPILGVGIALPFNIDPNSNKIISFFSNDVSSMIPLDSFLASLVKHFSVPYFAENDVNLAAMAELFNRKDSTEENLCYLSLGSGYGSGIIIDGSLFLGSKFRAGEIGNMLAYPVDLSKPLDEQIFPLENYINIKALNDKFHINLRKGKIENADLRDQMIAYISPYLSMSIYNIAFFLDISSFILDGFIPDILGHGLMDKVGTIVNSMLSSRKRTISISRSSKSHSALIGAALRVFDKALIDKFDD